MKLWPVPSVPWGAPAAAEAQGLNGSITRAAEQPRRTLWWPPLKETEDRIRAAGGVVASVPHIDGVRLLIRCDRTDSDRASLGVAGGVVLT
jgi:hypothetical protein